MQLNLTCSTQSAYNISRREKNKEKTALQNRRNDANGAISNQSSTNNGTLKSKLQSYLSLSLCFARTRTAKAISLGEGLGHKESNDYSCNKITKILLYDRYLGLGALGARSLANLNIPLLRWICNCLCHSKYKIKSKMAILIQWMCCTIAQEPTPKQKQKQATQEVCIYRLQTCVQCVHTYRMRRLSERARSRARNHKQNMQLFAICTFSFGPLVLDVSTTIFFFQCIHKMYGRERERNE